MKKQGNALAKNTVMLYIMNIAKIVVPLISLPYLTRVLSKDSYGTVSYVKAAMQYMQIVIDFGFLLSATKDIVQAKGSNSKINEVLGDTLLAKLLLVVMAFIALCFLTAVIPLLRANVLLTLLSFVPIALTCFLMDYLFRGIEQMQVITYRYVTMKLISVALTFVFVRSDADILWIPILDILSSLVAVFLVAHEVKKRGYRLVFTGVRSALNKLKDSFIYFLSSMATTTFNVLNTILIGIYMNAQEVADWSLCLQMVTAVTSMYAPITDSLYPHMVKTKDLGLIKKTAKVFMLLVTAGCVLLWFIAKYVLIIVGGEGYAATAPLLRSFIPLLFFCFPAMLVGWPTLGAINRVKETTKTTIITAGLQLAGMILLLVTDCFTVINLALLRGCTEACLFAFRFSYVRRYRSDFARQ